ncbi:Uncharacterised protein [Mycobacteroides abscessus subsp. massiliense]|nr:Uncharacterised protein [Mycobacteroides abscessus subsp. massiliense]
MKDQMYVRVALVVVMLAIAATVYFALHAGDGGQLPPLR